MPLSDGPGPRINATFSVRDGVLTILDRPVFGGSQDELLDQFEVLAKSAKPSLVVTLNVDQTLRLQDDAGFAQAVREAELVVIDGTPISWLGELLGAADYRRNTGADLLPAASRRSWNLAIAGGRQGIVEAAAKSLSGNRATVSAVAFPMIESIGDPAGEGVVHALAEHEPSVVFLCLGAPKQELWYRHWREMLPPAVYVGAGAAVDFAAGRVRRAPRLVQLLGLEWLFRVAQEPRRLAARYVVRGPQFIGVIVRSLWAAFRGDPDARGSTEGRSNGA